MLKLILFISAVITSSVANAFYTDSNLFYFSRSLEVDSTPSSGTQMLIDLSAGFDVYRKWGLTVGWSYAMFSTSDTEDSDQTTISASEMGPRFGGYFDRERNWGMAFTYNLIATTKYQTGGGTEQTWRGATYKVEIGWAPQITDNFYAGIRLNYYSAAFNEKIENTTDYEQVTYPRSLIYPAIYLSYRM